MGGGPSLKDTPDPHPVSTPSCLQGVAAVFVPEHCLPPRSRYTEICILFYLCKIIGRCGIKSSFLKQWPLRLEMPRTVGVWTLEVPLCPRLGRQGPQREDCTMPGCGLGCRWLRASPVPTKASRDMQGPCPFPATRTDVSAPWPSPFELGCWQHQGKRMQHRPHSRLSGAGRGPCLCGNVCPGATWGPWKSRPSPQSQPQLPQHGWSQEEPVPVGQVALVGNWYMRPPFSLLRPSGAL